MLFGLSEGEMTEVEILTRQLEEIRKAAQHLLQVVANNNHYDADWFREQYPWLKPYKSGIVWCCTCDAWTWACDSWSCHKCGKHAKDCDLPGLSWGKK
jgi:hypothetical protein